MADGAVAGALVEVRDLLKAAGVNVAIEPADLVLPGVILYPSLLTFERLDSATFRMDVDLLFVAAQVRALDAIDQLDALIALVNQVLPVRELRAVMIQLASLSPDELPAFQATVGLEVTPTE